MASVDFSGGLPGDFSSLVASMGAFVSFSGGFSGGFSRGFSNVCVQAVAWVLGCDL